MAKTLIFLQLKLNETQTKLNKNNSILSKLLPVYCKFNTMLTGTVSRSIYII